MTLIKDLILIPERVHQGDFVLKLSEGVERADETLRNYVVTPQLVSAFDNALAFVKSAVESRSSKAAYLHGSFGSGKSHFMAVLSLLLNGNVQARSIAQLSDVVSRHNSWTQDRKVLVVPYHMIGADDMESAILGGYAAHIRKLHPDAPIPGFYLAEGLFSDAQRIRGQLTDGPFFEKLNAGKSAGRWGALGGGWDAQAFEAAMLEPPAGEERMRLVGDLIDVYFESYRTMAASKGESFVSLDDGLSIMSKHASALGYDAVVLFLDELILWLASRAADVSFVSSEGTKLVKLVEATHADRPVPLVRFVARQRDLRELVGETLAAGAVQTQFADSLKYWEARFHKITLEDRNLPAIVESRILKPVSSQAQATLDQAFASLLNVRNEVLETLLTDDADRAMFRKLYPFSPALVETLIAVSSALQRERTALKLLMQLLVERREELELGEIVGVGDLWDVIAEGDEPFSEQMRIHFENAKRLWQHKLLPRLERQHGVTWQAVRERSADASKARALRNDARLLKTLLLAALVPEVKSLRALTGQRLAALNHGTVRSPIPGREASDVLRKCRDWAVEIGEIKITDDQNPIISIQVTGIDIEPIIAAAKLQDSPGNRKRLIREMLFSALGIEDKPDLFSRYTFDWRGSRREAEILYDNVRDISDDRLVTSTDGWTIIIDFPFDEPRYSPADDRARLQKYAGVPTRTIAWLPQFLSDKAQRELGRLVILDYILKGDQRFAEASSQLSHTDRAQAKALATNQRDQLKARLRQCLEASYGISDEPRDGFELSIERSEQYFSLEPTFAPQRPVGANLKEAIDKLLDQALSHQFPLHPFFNVDIRLPTLKKAWAEILKAVGEKDHRALVEDKATRLLVREVVLRLQLGELSSTHLHLHDFWRTHFVQCAAREPGPLTVQRLRAWLDLPRPRGLPVEAANLVVMTFAAQTNRSFRYRGGSVEPSLDSLSGDCELIEQELPSESTWQRANHLMSALFGEPPRQSLNVMNVERLQESLHQRITDVRAAIDSLARALPKALATFVSDPEKSPRLQTVRSARDLLNAVGNAAGLSAIESLSNGSIATSEAAMGQTLARARDLDETVRNLSEVFSLLPGIADERQREAQQILSSVGEALASDEHAVSLKPRLKELERRAFALVQQAVASSPAPKPTVSARPGVRIVKEGREANLDRSSAITLLRSIEAQLDETKRLSVSWTITQEDGSK
jgi:hypothetical protein